MSYWATTPVKGGKLQEPIFDGDTINTVSMLCVEDALDGAKAALAAKDTKTALAQCAKAEAAAGAEPTLVLAASHDKLFAPAQMSALAAGIPGARFVAVEGGGHLVPMEQPQAVADALADWILG